MIDRLQRENSEPHDWLTAYRSRSCATASSTTGWNRRARPTPPSAKRVYYLSLEFLIGRLMRDAVSNLGLMDELREALASLGVDSTSSPSWSPMQRSATAVSAVLPPASWKAWQPSTFPPMATASAMPRPVPPADPRRLAGRAARNLACPRQPMGIRAPRKRLRNRLRRFGRPSITAPDGRRKRYVWKPAERVHGGCL
jgi:hypothetical protein